MKKTIGIASVLLVVLVVFFLLLVGNPAEKRQEESCTPGSWLIYKNANNPVDYYRGGYPIQTLDDCWDTLRDDDRGKVTIINPSDSTDTFSVSYPIAHILNRPIYWQSDLEPGSEINYQNNEDIVTIHKK